MNVNNDTGITIQLTVNGQEIERTVPLAMTLRELLHRDLKHSEVKFGCGEGVCGACMVLLDGEPVASCLLLAAQAIGRNVVTVAGLTGAHDDQASAPVQSLQAHLLTKESFQCGYCACGMQISAAHALRSNNQPALSEQDIRSALSGNLCRCTGYQQIVDATLAAARGEQVSQTPYQRHDLKQKLQGTATYPSDLRPNDSLIGRVLWSEYPAANVKRVDVSDALNVAGVEAVLTCKDIPGRNIAGTPVFVIDQKLLAENSVRSMGDAVALVAARTNRAAREAIARIKVDYEPQQPVTDVLESIAPGARRIGGKGNVIAQFTEFHGDLKTGFHEAEVVVAATYRCALNDHACMELEGGAGWYNGDVLELRVPNQCPHTSRDTIAKMLGVRPEKVRILAPLMGGSFGKYGESGIEAHLALLVHRTKKPVRLVLDREESLQRRTKRHPLWGTYRLGLKRDGTITALEADVIVDAGPYAASAPAVASIFATEIAGAYDIPNIQARARGVLTNSVPRSAMRGYGSQQVSFGIESLIERAAHELGIPPAALRRKNFVRSRKDGQGRELPEMKSSLGESMMRVEALLGNPPAPPSGWIHGRGFGTVHAKYGYFYGLVDRSVAKITIDNSGAWLVEADVTDSGSGINAGIARLVAEYFQLKQLPVYELSQTIIDEPTGILLKKNKSPARLRAGVYRLIEWFQQASVRRLLSFTAGMEAVRLARMMRLIARVANFLTRLPYRFKSWLYPYCIDSFLPRLGSSRGTLMSARAAYQAAERLKQNALTIASNKLEVPVSELTVDGDGVRHRSDPQRNISWQELARQNGGKLTAIGEAELPEGVTLDPKTGNQLGPVDFMDGTHGCDLAIDPDTGEIKILQFVACHDVGRALNPAALRGQIYGGITMGIGQALYEKIIIKNGVIANSGLHDYLVPTSLEAPANVKIEFIESGNGLGPHGAKGIGESAAVAAPIAIANAIYDATGVQPTSIPVTPEDIVGLLESQERAPRDPDNQRSEK